MSAPAVNALDTWRTELERNRDALSRLSEEAAEIEQRVNSAPSILEQAMLKGSLVEKRKKVVELERANRRLEQRIGQTEESPLIPTG
jgi:predicted  nucleic acid-binding Zn-ribbon protein